MIDFHIHSKEHFPDAKIIIEDYVIKAIKIGLKSICFTDHFTLPEKFIDPSEDKTNSLSLEEFRYINATINKLRPKYQSEIEILFGAEVDFLPDHLKETGKLIEKFKFDYVKGSVHFMGKYKEKNNLKELGIDSNEQLWLKGAKLFGGIKNFVTEYYKYIQNLVKSRLFDDCGHLDLIKIFNSQNYLFDPEEKWYQDVVLKTLEIIKANNMSIELNTRGEKRPCGEFYPSKWILSEAYKLKIPVTIGSDSHSVDILGMQTENAIKFLKEVGYSKVCKYIKRKRIFVNI